MKELSIEEKAKAYDIALDKIKRLLGTGSNCSREELEYVFPELAESEDEKIIKEMKDFFSHIMLGQENFLREDYDWNAWIAWLEKQGEHARFREAIQVGDQVTKNEDGVLVNLSQLKRVAKKDEKQGEQKPVQEIEPAPIFKIGDILKRKGRDYTFRVDRIQGGYYHCDRNHGAFFPIEEQGNWELVEQKPAEDRYMEGYLNGINDTLKPAAWSEKYIADVFEKVGLAKIVREHGDDNLTNALQSALIELGKFMSQQKPWNEEDEKMWLQVINEVEAIKSNSSTIFEKNIAQDKIDWLNSLKDRVQSQQKQEWSEEDRETIDYLIDYLESELDSSYTDLDKETFTKEINWLKSLRDRAQLQSHWKPSDELDEASYQVGIKRVLENPESYGLTKYNWRPSEEQMNALNDVISSRDIKYDVLSELWKDLKRLRKE